jgi:membrane protein DedA with SNARE-associated domain
VTSLLFISSLEICNNSLSYIILFYPFLLHTFAGPPIESSVLMFHFGLCL